MDPKIKENMKSSSTWTKGLFLILFACIWGVVEIVAFAIVVFQFFHLLITGECNDKALKLGKSLSIYCYHIMMFLTFNRDEKPYPFSDWSEKI